MRTIFRLLIIAGLSATLLVACGDKEPKVDEALESAKTHTENAATEAKEAAIDAVQAAKEAAAVAKKQIKETTEATEKAVSDN
ncbi:MAG TPA: hypothetical protein VK950_05555 [Methylophilus sp.]|nr:hypothetical protein [Methylophilus sp.]